jgi:hypothetical protein
MVAGVILGDARNILTAINAPKLLAAAIKEKSSTLA